MRKYKLLSLSGDSSVIQGRQGIFYETLKEYSQYWEQIDVICPQGNTPQINFIKPNVFLHGTRKLPWGILDTFIQAEQVITDQKPDLITSHDYGLFHNGYIAAYLSRRHHMPWVSEIYHVEGYPQIRSVSDFIIRVLGNVYLKSAAKKAISFRVMTENHVPQFLTDNKISTHKIKLLPAVYVDPSVFNYDNDSKKNSLVWIGRLDDNKNWSQFIDLVNQIEKELHLPAIMVTNGSPTTKATEYAYRLGVERLKIVQFVDSRKELADTIKQSRILVVTSKNEGGPRVVAEALACGVPVVSSDVGVVRDYISGKNGRIYDGSIQDLIAQTHVVIDPKAYPQFVKSALQTRIPDKTTTIRNLALAYHQIIEDFN